MGHLFNCTVELLPPGGQSHPSGREKVAGGLFQQLAKSRQPRIRLICAAAAAGVVQIRAAPWAEPLAVLPQTAKLLIRQARPNRGGRRERQCIRRVPRSLPKPKSLRMNRNSPARRAPDSGRREPAAGRRPCRQAPPPRRRYTPGPLPIAE